MWRRVLLVWTCWDKNPPLCSYSLQRRGFSSQQVMEAAHLLPQETWPRIYKAMQVHARSAVQSWGYWVNDHVGDRPCPPPRYAPLPALACYLLYDVPLPTPLTIDFPCGPLSLPFRPYIVGCFQLALSLQPPAHTGSSLADFSILKMEAIRYSETSVHTSTRRHIPENGILHSQCRENLKSYIDTLVPLLYWYTETHSKEVFWLLSQSLPHLVSTTSSSAKHVPPMWFF
jgi:hypothetical protein